MAALTQAPLCVEVIKQHPGPEQAERAVKVMVPGKHFPALQPSEQKVDYEGSTAAEPGEVSCYVRAQICCVSAT